MASHREKVTRHKRRSRLEAKYHEMLRERANTIHELQQKVLFAEQPFRAEIEHLKVTIERLELELDETKRRDRHQLLWCPACGERHIDEGEFAMKEHHTHACQHCGMVWRPAIGPTFGVRYLPGFKNREETVALLGRLAELRDSIAVVGHDERPQQIIDELIRLVRP